MPALPESTERLLRAIDRSTSARGLVLAGGTALALRIEHRRSGDLDFVFPRKQLPQRRVALLLETLRRAHSVAPFPNAAAEREFLDSGLELTDYQQDYAVDSVKVTFFVPEPQELGSEISSEEGVAGLKNVRVADLQSLFLMKTLALNSRTTMRDLFDVYTLIERHGCRAADIFKSADRFGYSSDALKTRLLNATPRADDAGIEITQGIAPTFEQLKAYFAELIDRHEQHEAEAQAKRRRRRR